MTTERDVVEAVAHVLCQHVVQEGPCSHCHLGDKGPHGGVRGCIYDATKVAFSIVAEIERLQATPPVADLNTRAISDDGNDPSRAALEEAAKRIDELAASGSRMMLCAGEMTAGELRTSKAILAYAAHLVRNAVTAGVHVTEGEARSEPPSAREKVLEEVLRELCDGHSDFVTRHSIRELAREALSTHKR